MQGNATDNVIDDIATPHRAKGVQNEKDVHRYHPTLSVRSLFVGADERELMIMNTAMMNPSPKTKMKRTTKRPTMSKGIESAEPKPDGIRLQSSNALSY